MMTIQYCSDLHLELPENTKWLQSNPLVPSADILILAGDVIPFVAMEQCADFISFLADHFQATYWLPGNHEYFGSDITAGRYGSFREAIRPNVFLLNNQVEQVEDVALVFSTLWSHISPAAEWDIARSVTDYRSILQDGQPFRPLHSNRLHAECLSFAQSAVADVRANNSKVVVATHHVPTLQNYPKQFKGSLINEAFASELYDYIGPSGINAWIYGHHHCNTPEFMIGNTRLLTNQLGYIRKREYYGFRKDAVIQVY
jgi:predicted phosphohydrolase